MSFLVKDVMNRNVITGTPDLTVKNAAEIMHNYRIGSLVILENNSLKGIVTESNILKAVSTGMDPEKTYINELMTTNVMTIGPDEIIENAIRMMMDYKIKKLPVVDGKKIVGIITSSDIIVIEPKMIESLASMLSMNFSQAKSG